MEREAGTRAGLMTHTGAKWEVSPVVLFAKEHWEAELGGGPELDHLLRCALP